jgi:phenylpyruvate tautomerase PptA (4-oxalocrotonate tautomerase family)
MPLVRIAVPAKLEGEKVQRIAESVHLAMVETISIPEDDRFQLISRYDDQSLIYDRSFLTESPRTFLVMIQILMRIGRTLHAKQILYRKIVERITAQTGIPASNIMIVLSENDLEDWSFSAGRAQYIEDPQLFAKRGPV